MHEFIVGQACGRATGPAGDLASGTWTPGQPPVPTEILNHRMTPNSGWKLPFQAGLGILAAAALACSTSSSPAGGAEKPAETNSAPQAAVAPKEGPAPAAKPAPAKKETAKAPAKIKKLTGADLYSIHCNRCHPERYPTEFTASQWKTIGTHMRVRANIPAAQAREIIKYLQEDSGN